jgi:uncharacterized protein YcbK (DUF882 family)
MSISPATFGAGAVTEQPSAQDVRSERDRAPDEFAGLLAGAVSAQPKAPEPAKAPKDGTSELDRHDESETDEAKPKRGHRATAGSHSASSANTKTGDPSQTVIQSVAALDPELQAKLARVMARMQNETGHDVQVAETLRTQARQNALYAQGRETPGPVVTWTTNSKHTEGRAVDLVLDNGSAGSDAYAALQRIAGEEGLRTLGARDPGHLELPGSGPALKGAADATSLIPAEPADATGPGQVSIARLAQVAQVTQVSAAPPAKVADVANVAKVDVPGMAAKTTTFAATPANRAPHGEATQSVQQLRHVAGDAQSASHRFSGDTTDSEGGTAGGEHHGYSALAAAVALRDAATDTSATQSVTTASTMTPAERAAKLIAAFEDAPPRPLSQITMSVDAGNGTADRVQLAMRGSSLNATIDAADPRAAQTMTARSDELVRALSRDGIELDALRVRAAAGTATTQAAVAPQSSPDTNTHSRFERGNAWQHQQDRQRSQDDRRQQQRDQRGGQQQ